MMHLHVGVASIDAKEAGHTEWTAPAGMTSPPLQLLLKVCTRHLVFLSYLVLSLLC